ncbi:TPA: DUF1642 domain-containing protein [Streptococcus suis]|uniref:DUF1642 domain-containing protein n=1 Tax=Streptococcus suis TaxID=1307 RepID=UPI0015533AB5|nr:DUF1642 domain-containing protein [Streptococcus suis]NQJ61223.1 DUF1642 domain-containing protein [Streptococcus suis]NQJ65164.1 DUF1642 domain-containing protein [Streptococcus suis]UUM45914.1 DUF1642 domain-containing protein [Streptococcus suis]HEL2551282.1 DUF1642 domain-containing protein [Streptococcus suis]HEM6093466.1 DUF1642 domain-containing protein [Streptococcus suis]
MNKQEAIELLQKMAQESFEFAKIHAVHIDSIVEVINQIHEPQTAVVPKFVAEWIEKCKNMNCSLRDAMTDARNHEELNTWFLGSNEDKGVYHNQDIFARAWLDGYEVEQEQLYTVEIPDPNRPDIATFLYKENGKVFIGTDIFLDEVPNYKWKKEPENQLTESEIKQDFEWAWDAGFAKEVE